MSAEQAQSDAETVAQEIMRNYPAMMANLHINALVLPLQKDTTDQARPLLRTLFLAVAVVLLIACANLAGLMLVRAIRKQREVAVRLALGARASSLLGQAILESLVLSVSGGVNWGIGSGSGGAVAGKASMLPESLPRISEIGLNWNVVGFAMLLGVLTGLLCGLVPVFAALRTNVNVNLKEGGRSGSEGGGHARLRSTLVVAEIYQFNSGAARRRLYTAAAQLREDEVSGTGVPTRACHHSFVFAPTRGSTMAKQSQIDERFNRELLRR